MGLTVRPAEGADVPAIVECYLRSWRAAYVDDLGPDDLVTESEKRRTFDWAGGIDDAAAGVFVATQGRDVVGVVQVNLSLPAPRDLPEVLMLYVDPRSWGTGAARALLDAGTAWIWDQGHPEARLQVVESHQRARRFYEREGWVRDDTIAPTEHLLGRLVHYRRTSGR